jgi:anti-anti-sigma factor
MTSQTKAIENASLVKLSGDIDMSCAEELLRLEKALTQPAQVIFDVSELGYVDTTFLRFLVHVKHQANKTASNAIKLTGVRKGLRRVMEITGLSRRFVLEPL